MFAEPSRLEIMIIWAANVVASLACSQVHKSLYYLLGLSFWAMHFCHYLITFLALTLLCSVKLMNWQPIASSAKLLWPLVLSEAAISIATCAIHMGGSDGAVHSIRVTDFAVTLFVLLLAHRFIDSKFYSFSDSNSKRITLLVLIAVSSSVAWMEPLLFLNYAVYLAWPVIIVSTGLHFMLCFEIAQKHNISPQMLCLYVCGYTSVVISPFALFITSDAFNHDRQDTLSTLEAIDYVMIVVTCVFVSLMVLTKYVLLCKLTPESYAVARHSKYLMASYGQWLLQNMAYVTPISVVGKALATISILHYAVSRWNGQKVMGLDPLSIA